MMAARPGRIQLRRAKGWRMPGGAIKVDRTTPWGNPFMTGVDGTAETCVRLYELLLAGCVCITCKSSMEAQRAAFNHVRDHLHELRGHDLACWCRPGAPCHADVLLKIANAP